MKIHRKNLKTITKNKQNRFTKLNQYHHIKLEHICKTPLDMSTCERFGGACEWRKIECLPFTSIPL